MNKEKQMQIPQELFFELTRYFLLDKRDAEREEHIKRALNNKIDAAVKHEIYTRYKTAATEEEKEKARQEYLNKIGLNSSFRW